MVNKRPFDGEGQHEVTSKLPRQEHCDGLALFSEFGSFGDTPKVPDGSGEGGCTVRKVEQELGEEKKTKPPLSNEEEVDCTFPGCYSISSWGTSSTSEEDIWSEAPFHGSFFPEYFYPQRPVRTLPRYEDIYSLLLEGPPQKSVPIGPDHQADIPALREQDFENVSNSASVEANPNSDGQQLEQVTRVEDEGHPGGVCVIPMPNYEQFGNSDDKIGNDGTDCFCGDRGSFRCVRKHVVEARDKLKRDLGPETFAELGFFDMGEHVAEKWTDEEEKIFYEIVFSNPASIGKNFWNNLSAAFPSRMKGEIVSYYFNVFMLRKRAEQNRCDPMNIDSDNDEWQVNEEEEDSVVESPVHGVDPADSIHRDHVSEYDDDDDDDDVADEPCDDDGNTSFRSHKLMADVPEGWPGKNNYQENPTFRLEEKTWDGRVDQGAQDDSCTSSDTVAVSQGSHGKDYDGCHDVCFDRLNGDRSPDDETELCIRKVWSAGCMACPKKEVDFLPTFSMIEEVFGHGSSNCKSDRKDLG